MATLTLRLKEADDKVVLDLLKRYGLTQASKAITKAFHEAHERIPNLMEQNNDLREENRTLWQMIRSASNSHEGMIHAEKRHNDNMKEIFIQLNSE